MVGSSWRSEPAAALRGFAKSRSSASPWRRFSSSNDASDMNTSPRTSSTFGGFLSFSFSGTSAIVRTFAVTSSPVSPLPRVAARTNTPSS